VNVLRLFLPTLGAKKIHTVGAWSYVKMHWTKRTSFSSTSKKEVWIKEFEFSVDSKRAIESKCLTLTWVNVCVQLLLFGSGALVFWLRASTLTRRSFVVLHSGALYAVASRRMLLRELWALYMRISVVLSVLSAFLIFPHSLFYNHFRRLKKVEFFTWTFV
jgi:hypothetical protein